MTKLVEWVGARVSRVTDATDLRDVHVYGGLLLVAVGLVGAFGWWGLAVPGAGLFYLGVWRIR